MAIVIWIILLAILLRRYEFVFENLKLTDEVKRTLRWRLNLLMVLLAGIVTVSIHFAHPLW